MYWFPLKVLYASTVVGVYTAYYRGAGLYGFFNGLLLLLMILNIYWFYVSFSVFLFFNLRNRYFDKLTIFISSLFCCFCTKLQLDKSRRWRIRENSKRMKPMKLMKKRKKIKSVFYLFEIFVSLFLSLFYTDFSITSTSVSATSDLW